VGFVLVLGCSGGSQQMLEGNAVGSQHSNDLVAAA
jgi:hypothetical protein